MAICREEYLSRIAAVRSELRAAGASALVVGASARLDGKGLLRWLFGYTFTSFEDYALIPLDGDIAFFAHDAGGAARATASGVVSRSVVIPNALYDTDPAQAMLPDLASLQGVVALGGTDICSARFFDSLRRALPGCSFLDFSKTLWKLRMIKSPAELEETRDAVRVNEEAFLAYVAELHRGGSSLSALAAAQTRGYELGMEDNWWLGEHHDWRSPSDYPSQHLVLEHSGPGGHFGEVGQPLLTRKPDELLLRAQEALITSIRLAADEIRPGNTTADVARAAQRYLVDNGWIPAGTTPYCIGHGQGLDFWEPPFVSTDDETELQAGMRLNLHPSIPLPGGGRVSYCDCYVCGEEGPVRLTKLPYDLQII